MAKVSKTLNQFSTVGRCFKNSRFQNLGIAPYYNHDWWIGFEKRLNVARNNWREIKIGVNIHTNNNFLGLSYRKVFKMNFFLKTLKLLSILVQSLFSLFLSPSVSGRNQSVERGGWWHCFPKPTHWPFGKSENICVLPVKFYKKYCSMCFNSYKKLLQLISVNMLGPCI